MIALTVMKPILDYWLNKLFFDLHTNGSLLVEYRKDPHNFLTRYNLSDNVRVAIETDDVVTLARLTNPFLLRYYFLRMGMTDERFIERLQPLREGSVKQEMGRG
jgi:hypothetical protein